MASRLELHEKLCELLGSRNVYFQPPESIKLKYPCIVYSLNSPWQRTADNKKYLKSSSYTLTLIVYDPDSPLVEELEDAFTYCSLESPYVADNLNHYNYRLYY